jgi:tRNA-modifying protein YgfZ
MPMSDAVRALEGSSPRVFADLSGWSKVEVAGADAATWLNDLVTNRVDDVGRGASRRTLLLDRTGRVKADLHALGMRGGSLLLVQDPAQPFPILDLLDRYVLSSDVTLTDRAKEYALFSHPTPGGWTFELEGDWRPSVLGSGLDRLVPAPKQAAERDRYAGWIEATEHDLEVWRIRRGVPRFAVDFGDDWLPSEAGLDGLIDATKGCFLGQESVARVRNLGHPPRLVQAFVCDRQVSPGASITAGGDQVGRITGVAENDDGSVLCIGWIRWDARDAELTAEGGLTLARRAAG